MKFNLLIRNFSDKFHQKKKTIKLMVSNEILNAFFGFYINS
jgi:hypothetical protein